jgi:hypothetical protein
MTEHQLIQYKINAIWIKSKAILTTLLPYHRT